LRSKATSYPYPSFFKYFKNWAEWKIINTMIFSHKKSSNIIKLHNDGIIEKNKAMITEKDLIQDTSKNFYAASMAYLVDTGDIHELKMKP